MCGWDKPKTLHKRQDSLERMKTIKLFYPNHYIHMLRSKQERLEAARQTRIDKRNDATFRILTCWSYNAQGNWYVVESSSLYGFSHQTRYPGKSIAVQWREKLDIRRQSGPQNHSFDMYHCWRTTGKNEFTEQIKGTNLMQNDSDNWKRLNRSTVWQHQSYRDVHNLHPNFHASMTAKGDSALRIKLTNNLDKGGPKRATTLIYY